MNVEILFGPGNAAAKVRLAPGETCTAEGGAMIAMSADMGVTTSTYQRGRGGLLQSLRRAVAGESIFMNHFQAGSGGGDLYLATTLPGDMATHTLRGERLIVQGGSFVACEAGIHIDLGWQGFKALLSGENVFWVHLSGDGLVIFNAFGAIYPVDVEGEYIVDTGHIVAFQETLNFTLSKAGKSWFSSFLGGEGFVCRFNGRGRIWCQSHNPKGFGRLLGSLLPPR